MAAEPDAKTKLSLAFWMLKYCKPYLTKQQFLCVKGQILNGDCDGACKGMIKLLRRVEE